MRFRVTLLAVFAAVYLYLGFGILGPVPSTALRVAGALALFLVFAAIAWVPLVFWQLESEETTLAQRSLLWLSFGGMGFLSFALVLTVLRDLASLAAPGTLRTPASSAWIVLLALLFVLGGFFRAHFGVRLRTVNVPLTELPHELAGLKIVQISDLHVGPTIRREFVEKVASMANRCEPDLVVITGDVADGSVRDLHAEIAPLAAIRARLGRFYVTGNHEYYWEGPPWIARLNELGFTPLLNSNVILTHRGRRFAVAGVPDPTAATVKLEGPDFTRACQGIPDDAYPRIVLCHQPKFAEKAEEAGFDLQLSGHTHGGQFFPWTLIASWVHRHNVGLHGLKKLMIYVSRGTGYWGPPVRVGSPGEVTLLILKKTGLPDIG